MTEKVDQVDQEEPGQAQAAMASPEAKCRRAFKNIRREIDDKDLSNPAVGRMLLDSIEQLETDLSECKPFVGKYHEADKKASILEERLKTKIVIDILQGMSLAVGGILIKMGMDVWDQGNTGKVLFSLGAIFIVGAIVVKTVKP